MNKKEKQRKRVVISTALDLAGAHLKDSEVDTLFDIVSAPKDYDGTSKTVEKSYTSWCSDGKYKRKESTTYTLFSGDEGVRVEEDYVYHDDDGQHGGNRVIHTSARMILRSLSVIFDN